MQRRLFAMLGLLLALALVAAACGNDDDSDGAITEPDPTAAAAGDDGDDDGDGDAAGDDDASADSTDDGDGEALPSGVLDLGGGAVLDTTQCPEEWDNNAGVDDDEIRFGVSGPRSGTLAGFGTIMDGMQIYFDAIGPVDGRKVTIVSRDDGYESTRTRSNVEEMIDTEDLLGFAGIIGSPNNLAIRELLNDNCIPQVLNLTGLPEWGDPNNFPWTTGSLLAYNTEANIWCSHIAEEMGAGATVAVLYMNNDFGRAYQDAFGGCAAEEGLEIVDELLHDPAADSIASEITTLSASGADVLILGTTAAYCPQSMLQVSSLQAWNPVVLVSSTCQTIGLFWVPIGPLADGFRIVASFKDVADQAAADDEWVQFVRSSLEAAGIDPEATSHSLGFNLGEAVHETLLAASAMEGGINRANFMRASWQLNFVSRSGIDNATRIVDGANDSYLIESGRIETYVWDPEARAGSYQPISGALNFEGQTGTFSGS